MLQVAIQELNIHLFLPDGHITHSIGEDLLTRHQSNQCRLLKTRDSDQNSSGLKNGCGRQLPWAPARVHRALLYLLFPIYIGGGQDAPLRAREIPVSKPCQIVRR